jgi:hypothetical protein
MRKEKEQDRQPQRAQRPQKELKEQRGSADFEPFILLHCLRPLRFKLPFSATR